LPPQIPILPRDTRSAAQITVQFNIPDGDDDPDDRSSEKDERSITLGYFTGSSNEEDIPEDESEVLLTVEGEEILRRSPRKPATTEQYYEAIKEFGL
jgi:hypothetical protein